MGLAVLPSRLKGEMAQLEAALTADQMARISRRRRMGGAEILESTSGTEPKMSMLSQQIGLAQAPAHAGRVQATEAGRAWLCAVPAERAVIH